MQPTDWPFDDKENVAVFTTNEILEGQPILYVSHNDEDGAWQFSGGSGVSTATAKVVSLKLITTRHPEVLELADLPYGWKAYRASKKDDWQREKDK